MSHKPAPAPSRPLFVGVDSDGTVFDSLEVKHKASERSADLQELALATAPLSAGSLAGQSAAKQSPFIAQLFEWSRRSDDLCARMSADGGKPPYPLVRDSLKRAPQSAEIMVVSPSVREAGLLPLTTRVLGQEMGSKATQTNFALEQNRGRSCALMAGDAQGNPEAARANHTLSCPIVPGAGRQSWERFFQEAYEGEHNAELSAGFESARCHDDSWSSHDAWASRN